MSSKNMHDRVGIGWRPELAAGILSNLDRIDVLEAVESGRLLATVERASGLPCPLSCGHSSYTPSFEQFLARLYTDPAARARFLADPRAEAARAGLSSGQSRALEAIDRIGLKLAARSFAHKRARKHSR
jgi:hypothetical protein